MALRVIHRSTSQRAFAAVVQDDWSWNISWHPQENQWGSIILAEQGQHLPFSQIIRRIDPIYLGYAVFRRGTKPDEVAAYAELLHVYWRVIGNETPELPADLPMIYLEDSPDGTKITRIDRRGLADKQNDQSAHFTAMAGSWGGNVGMNMSDFEDMMGGNFEQNQRDSFAQLNDVMDKQVAVGNYWFARRFLPYVFDEVLNTRPDLVEQWVNSVLNDDANNSRKIRAGSAFYERLCKTLLQTHPDQGVALYQRLNDVTMYVFTRDSSTHIRLLDYALFRASATEAVEQAWQQRLEEATTDQELLEVAILALMGNAQNWLRSYIEGLLQSDVPLSYMRGLTILGLVDDPDYGDRLAQLQNEVPDSWIRQLVKLSLLRWQQNTWAKHWFRRFLTVEDDLHAWAAFRLFLRCVDRRFWLWQTKMIEQIGRDNIAVRRLCFFAFNNNNVESKAKKNEKEMSEHFLGQKAMKGDMWPWM